MHFVEVQRKTDFGMHQICCSHAHFFSFLFANQFDCGVHPTYAGISSLPFFDAIDDPAAIDLVLISQ